MNNPDFSNPYAAPEAEIIAPPSSSGRVWIEKKSLVVPKDWQSPPICLLTGETMDLRPIRRKKLAWCNPVMIILIFLGIIGILILFLIQKRGTIYYYLSGGAADKLKKKLLINWGIFGLGVCLLASAALSRRANPELVTAGFATLLISALLGVTWCRLIKPRKIDKTHIWLLGIPPAVQEAIVAAEQESVQRAWR